MNAITMLLQVIVALGIFNVWLIRPLQKSPYRGGNASSLRDEFAAYGLPLWSFYLIGALKLGCAIALLAGLWAHVLVLPAALLLAILMLGAILMHIKVGDQLQKSLPALAMLLLCLAICVGSFYSH